MRRTVADWSAGALAVIVLTLGGLVVVKPAVDHWGDLYRADPFESAITSQKVEKERAGKPAKTTTTTQWAAPSFTERVLGNGGVLFIRLGIVALVALLAAAVLYRALLGDYALRARAAKAPALSGSEYPLDRTLRPSEESSGTPVSTRNGPNGGEQASGANLAPAIAKLVASRREELGLSQRELAKRAGMSHTVISRIESGEHSASPKTLERLADALRERH